MRVTETTPRRPRGTLYRYLFQEMAFPTAFALAGLTLVILTKDLLGYSELVINRGLGVRAVAMMALYQAVPLIGTTLPFATLVGCLVGLGRLGADLELLVLEASGVSARRLVLPVTAFAALVTLFGFVVSVFLGPWASRSLDASLERISLAHPGAQLQAGVVNRFGDWKLEAFAVNPRGDRLEGVLLWMPDIGETVFAERGELDPDGGGGIRLTLENAMVLLDPRDGPRQLRFGTLTAQLPESDLPISRSRMDRLEGMTLAELAELGRSDDYLAVDAATRVHRRFALPLATLIFGFLAVPLFMSGAQFSRAGGGVVGIVCTLFYYGLVQLGDGLIQRGVTSVALGAWLPNIAMSAIALLLFARLAGRTAFGRASDRPQQRTRWFEGHASSDGRVRVHRFALQRYVGGRFAQMALLCFGVVLVAYLLVDVLDRLQWLSRYGATADEMLRFYLARVPLLASRVVPMSLLVATSLTVSVIAAQGELMGMRACGIPAPRALLPVLVLCLVVAPFSFLLNNEVVPRTNALADYLKNTEIKEIGAEQRREAVWYRAGSYIIEADRLDPVAGDAEDIVIYELGRDWLPVSRLDARRARAIGGGLWRLRDTVKVEVGDGKLQLAQAGPVAALGDDVPAEIDTMHLSIAALREEIAEARENGRDATRFEVDFHVKLATPFACVLLPLVALLFAVAGPPFPSSSVSLVVSVVCAAGYTLLTGVGASLGYGGVLPPPLAGWFSTAIAGGVALLLGWRLRRFGQSF